MSLSDAEVRQAAQHALADAEQGVTRIQAVIGPYTDEYWHAYNTAAGVLRRDGQRPGGRTATPGEQHVPWAAPMLEEFRAAGDWTPYHTVLDDYAGSRMRDMWRSPGADPDGFEAG